MLIKLNKLPDSVVEISSKTYNVYTINSIQEKYKDLRNKSKAPTFALTYGGTYKTLIKNCGFSEEEAKQIEENYHKLYEVSDKWVQNKIDLAKLNGYVTVAFGLRVRTPALKQAMQGKLTNLQAQEARTAGNALGQSWGLLNDRAMLAVLEKVKASKFRNDILPASKIHDCCY